MQLTLAELRSCVWEQPLGSPVEVPVPTDPIYTLQPEGSRAKLETNDDDVFFTEDALEYRRDRELVHLARFSYTGTGPAIVAAEWHGWVQRDGSPTHSLALSVWVEAISAWRVIEAVYGPISLTHYDLSGGRGPESLRDADGYIDIAAVYWTSYTYGGSRRLYSDFCSCSARSLCLEEADNPFGQRFRLYGSSAPSGIEFESRDLPAGAWSTATEPFSGTDNEQAKIEYLPDGRLRATYLDNTGTLTHAESYDDGETWSPV